MNSFYPPKTRVIPGSSEQENDTIAVSAILSTIWRGKWILTTCALIGMMIGGYYAFVQAVPIYQASTTMILTGREESVVNLDSVVGNLSRDDTTLNSEVEVLRSRILMEQVVHELNLTEDPEFNTALQPPSLRSRIRRMIRSVTGTTVPDASPNPERARQRTIDRTVSRLINAITIEIVPRSSVFTLTASTEGATKSAQITDTLARLYIERQLTEKFEATEQASTWLSSRVADLEGQLEVAEVAVQNFSSSTELISAQTLNALERQLKDMRDRVRNLKASRDQALQFLASLRAAETPAQKAGAAQNPQLSAMLPRISDPTVARSFEQQFQRILTQSEEELARIETQLASLEVSNAALEEQIETQSSDLIELQQLSREAEATRTLYEYFLTRLKETSVQQGIQQADSRVLSNAVVPGAASSPRKVLILIASALLGFFVGSLLILIRETRKSTYRSPRELERLSGYPVMGQIPVLPTRRRKDALLYLNEKPSSAAAEAVRNLRTSVLLSNVDTPPQVIAVTSATPGEGKTTTSLALAQNFAGMGRKVLLIEGDIRRRIFNQYLPEQSNQGLIAVISGEAELANCVRYDEQTGTDVLTAEKTSINAADLFSSKRFDQMISQAREQYDTVIIDTPPVLVVPDARIVAQQVDALLFVVAWDQTSTDQVDEAIRMFSNSSRELTARMGMVLNKISPRGMRSYGYGNQYGAYSSYGRKYYMN